MTPRSPNSQTPPKPDVARSTKLNLLEKMTVVCDCRENGKRFCHCNMLIKSLLKALDGFARDHTSYAVTVSRLETSMGASKSTVKRAIKKAVDLGYLAVAPGDGTKLLAPGKSKSGTRSTYEIQWEKIWDEAEKEPPRAGSQKRMPPSSTTKHSPRLSHPYPHRPIRPI